MIRLMWRCCFAASWILVAALSVQLSYGMLAAADADATAGPDNFEDLFNRAPQFLHQMKGHTVGALIADTMVASLRQGIQINSDYSGIGSAEMALHTIAKSALGNTDPTALLFWRACDTQRAARKCLAANAECNSQHIFGNIMMRVSLTTRNKMMRAYDDLNTQFKELLGRVLDDGSRDARDQRAAFAEACGATLFNKLWDILSAITFNINAKAWCQKCKQNCRVHGPIELETNKLRMRVAVAGTTCTSWSSMGNKQQWTCASRN